PLTTIITSLSLHDALPILIEILHPPSAKELGCPCDTLLLRDVTKSFIFVVFVNRKDLMVHIRDKQILPSIAIDVCGIQPHARARDRKSTRLNSSHGSISYA